MVLAITEFAFLIFLFLSLVIYWFTKKWPDIQNAILLAICYLFYGYGIYEMIVFLIASTLFNYTTGLFLDIIQSTKWRKNLLLISITANLLYLGVIKYYNFFSEQIQSLLALFGIALDPLLVSILLPAGFSFFTFQVISYNIDIYRRTIQCTRNFVTFALFVAYFPKLIAGPIEKSSHLIPQLTAKKILKIENVSSGFQLIILGYFLKSLIADKIGVIIGNFYSYPQSYGSLEAYIITWFYTIQIYADFSGYTNIVRGISKLFGIDLMENFNQPYLAQNPRDFWQRWHISLTTWLREYIYIPLGGNRKGIRQTYLNILIVFVLSGLWHGAGLTFIIWGLLHGVYLVGHRYFTDIAKKRNFDLNQLSRITRIVVKTFFWAITLQLVSLAWIFFRSGNLDIAFTIIKQIFQFKGTFIVYSAIFLIGFLILLGGLCMIIDIYQNKYHTHEIISKAHWLLQGIIYASIIFLLLVLNIETYQPFIYQGF